MMTSPALRIAVVVGLIVGGATPALAQRREMQQMAADIRILQEQTQLLQNALVTLTDTLKAVNTRIDEQTGLNRKAFADGKLQSDAMGGDLRVVRERVDDTNVRITSLSQEVEALRLAIPPMATMSVPTDTASVGIPGSPSDQMAGTAPVPAGAAPAATASPAAPAGPIAAGSPARVYDTAWADYTAGNFDLAIEGFNGYVRSFPRSEFADNAQYYVGESYFQRGKLAEAVDAFGRVISTYPKSDVVGQAYYKRGLCYERLNQPDRAREAYDYVVKTLGDSDVSRLAKQRLDALNRARPQ
ncbi:MAG: tetratricopeptide repeat protein [Acidobacteriota bacterium]